MDEEVKRDIPYKGEELLEPVVRKPVEYDRKGKLGILALMALVAFGVFSMIAEKVRDWTGRNDTEQVEQQPAGNEVEAVADTLVLDSLAVRGAESPEKDN